MESFLENVPQHIIDAEIQTVSEYLFNEWMDSNLNEGQFFADYRFAEMSDSDYMKKEFNKHWDLSSTDDYYLEVE